MKLQPWKIFTDTAEHYKVFQIVRGYNIGVYTKDEFKSKLKNMDLSDLEDYVEDVKVMIKDALKEDKPVKTKVEEVATEENVIVEDTEAIVPRKRNYKINKVEVE